jgi:hypothetical protein
MAQLRLFAAGAIDANQTIAGVIHIFLNLIFRSGRSAQEVKLGAYDYFLSSPFVGKSG